MFRLILSAVLLIAFAIHTFQRGAIIAGYYLDSDAYAKNCENKAKPLLKCKGKCQLTKKIQQEEKKEQQQPERKDSKSNEALSSTSFYPAIIVNCPTKEVYLYALSSGKEVNIPHTLLRPPIC